MPWTSNSETIIPKKSFKLGDKSYKIGEKYTIGKKIILDLYEKKMIAIKKLEYDEENHIVYYKYL